MEHQTLSLDHVELRHKKVAIRLDLNVPMAEGRIADSSRLESALPTLRTVLAAGARVAVMAHLGRPGGKENPALSLAPVGEWLAAELGRDVLLVRDYEKEPIDQLMAQLGNNELVLLENLRFHPGEMANDPEFAARLMYGMDYFVQDGFGVLHRSHASTVGCPQQLPPHRRILGPLVRHELAQLEHVVSPSPDRRPYTVVVGGAKVSDKIGVILRLLESCNHLLVGGAMAYTFLARRGIGVGDSPVEREKMDLIDAITREASRRRVEIHLPVDHVWGREFAATTEFGVTSGAALEPGTLGLDIGPRTQTYYRDMIAASGLVLWNGPVGVFEWEPFRAGTAAVARAVAACPGYTVVGGGESVAACRMVEVTEQISHVSTGGGATLAVLEGKMLPGLRVLRQVSS